jgi:REP element-mobilizing transposase RayT
VPVLVTLRTVPGVRFIRNRDVCAAVRKALETTFRRRDFRVCQISIQQGHLHLIVEGDDRLAIARGMQGFQISAARRMNRAFTRRNGFPCKGQIFADRYHARAKTSPRQVRDALAYVLGNWRKHGATAAHAPGRVLDPYASAASFDGWRTRPPAAADDEADHLPVARPKGWLLSVGWRRHGLLDPRAAPGPTP